MANWKPYETHKTPPPSRGNYEGLSATEQDMALLEKLVAIVRRIDNATVAPHSSVLHQAYCEIEEVCESFGDSCPEATWARDTLRETQAIGARKKMAGALSVTQFRGTGEYWERLWRCVKRRLAEKAMCAVRDLQHLRAALLKLSSSSSKARSEQKLRLALLARVLALDEDIAVGFLNNGYDPLGKQFVRCPDLDAAQALLQALGAPLNFVPRPVRPRMPGLKFEVDPLA